MNRKPLILRPRAKLVEGWLALDAAACLRQVGFFPGRRKPRLTENHQWWIGRHDDVFELARSPAAFCRVFGPLPLKPGQCRRVEIDLEAFRACA